MKADDGLPVQIPRTFGPLAGTPANLAVLAASGGATLTQVIPPGGCNARMVATGTGGDVCIRLDGTAATTSDMRLLVGTVEVFTLPFGASITAISAGGLTGTTLQITLGMGA